MKFVPALYWEARLSHHLYDLEGVGQEGRSLLWNYFCYKAKVRSMNRALNKVHLDLGSSRMLDVGTGIGFWVDYFLAKGVDSIVGVDVAPSAIKLATEKYSKLGNCEFYITDISNDDFPKRIGRTFNLVMAMDILYHIIEDEKFCAAIRNIARILQPNGYLFVTGILSSSRDEMSPQQHVHWRGLTRYKRELEENGLDIVYLAPVYTLLQSPVDANGLFARLLNAFYYRMTFRLTSKAIHTPVMMEKVYLSTLYNLDSLMTLFPRFGVSTKLLVARKT